MAYLNLNRDEFDILEALIDFAESIDTGDLTFTFPDKSESNVISSFKSLNGKVRKAREKIDGDNKVKAHNSKVKAHNSIAMRFDHIEV